MGFKYFYDNWIPTPRKTMYYGITSINDEHKHEYEVNESGDGVALKIEPNGHQHNITGWIVEENDGHIHIIDRDKNE